MLSEAFQIRCPLQYFLRTYFSNYTRREAPDVLSLVHFNLQMHGHNISVLLWKKEK